MSVNTSSPTNSCLSGPFFDCTSFPVSNLISTAFSITRVVVLLPLSIFVLHLGYQQRRQQRSLTAASHSDIFTYHMAAMELIWILGLTVLFCGYSTDVPEMITVGFILFLLSNCGQTFFHLLTCVERYMAVVHPITYLGLRKARGVRIRNISIGCVWLLSLVSTGLSELYTILPRFSFLCPFIFCLFVISYCNLSVLCVLIRPAPGDGGRGKEQADQTKQRACVTIAAIMVVLWLWFSGFLVSAALSTSTLLDCSVTCVVMASAYWSSLPSALVLPLLYLHRAGKLTFL